MARFSCTGAENSICWTNPGALPPAPRHRSGTVVDEAGSAGDRGMRVGGDVDLGVAETNVRQEALQTDELRVRRWQRRIEAAGID